jgi:hypothetical protein
MNVLIMKMFGHLCMAARSVRNGWMLFGTIYFFRIVLSNEKIVFLLIEVLRRDIALYSDKYNISWQL